MTAHPVARYLVRFGRDNEVEVPQELPFVASVMPEPPEPAEDPTALIEDAKAQGYSEGYEAAAAETEARVAQVRIEFDDKLVEARSAWALAEGEKLAEQITASAGRLEADIAQCVENILRPFITDILRKRAVEELAQNVAILLAGDGHSVIRISGADDLLASLREKLPPTGVAIDYVSSQSPDVCVIAKQTTIETRIGAWLERLQAAAE